MKNPRREGKSSFVLSLLALIFFSMGISRLGMGVAEVLAADTSETSIEDNMAATQEQNPPRDPGDLFQTLRAREAQLQAAEASLQQRQEALRAAEAELEQKLNQLLEAETQLSSTLRLTATAAEDDLQHLTTVFESMKPVQAAQLFSEMDIEFAAGFLGRLRPEIAGEIMASLDPVIGYAISAVLAGRHARTPRN